MSKKNEYGTCALTLEQGKFVDAHIIPKALTKPEFAGAPLLQSSKGKGHEKRFSSWYDKHLVIRDGEDILAKIDDAGIKALRKNLLTWSSWTFHKPHFDAMTFLSNDHYIRQTYLHDSEAIHRFFVSIAWRACASTRPEMSEAIASDTDLEEMRNFLLNSNSPDPETFSVSLTQLTSVGVIHNASPVTKLVDVPSENGNSSYDQPIVRIYVDGLIAHVHLETDTPRTANNPMFVGTGDKTVIIGINFEASYQYENLLVNAFETYLGPLPSPDAGVE